MTPDELDAIANLLAKHVGMDRGKADLQIRDALSKMEKYDLAHYATLRDANVARQKEMGAGDKFSLLYWGNALAGEVGELCNVIKKDEREKLGFPGSRSTRADIEEEIADIYIYLDLTCMHLNLNASAAIQKKFNQTSEKLRLKTRLG